MFPISKKNSKNSKNSWSCRLHAHMYDNIVHLHVWYVYCQNPSMTLFWKATFGTNIKVLYYRNDPPCELGKKTFTNKPLLNKWFKGTIKRACSMKIFVINTTSFAHLKPLKFNYLQHQKPYKSDSWKYYLNNWFTFY